jgi:hypothetical protein
VPEDDVPLDPPEPDELEEFPELLELDDPLDPGSDELFVALPRAPLTPLPEMLAILLDKSAAITETEVMFVKVEIRF